MIHLLGNGTRPSGPSHGNVGVIGKYGTMIRASVFALENRVDLFSANDCAWNDGDFVRSACCHEPTATETLQLVPLTERLLPTPLKPSGHTPTSSTLVEQPFPHPARTPASSRTSGAYWPTSGVWEHQVGAQHPQLTTGRVMIQQRDRRHQRVNRDGS